MAEPLKHQFGPDVPRAIAKMVAGVWPTFPRAAFVRSALEGYEALELMPRGWKIAQVLRRYLPTDYPKAVEILLASLDQPIRRRVGQGMASFLFLPHVLFVAEYGLEHFEPSMHAQYVLTQRFTRSSASAGIWSAIHARPWPGWRNGRPIRARMCGAWCRKERVLGCPELRGFARFKPIRARCWRYWSGSRTIPRCMCEGVSPTISTISARTIRPC